MEYKLIENIISGIDIIKYEKVVQKKTKKKPQKTKQEQAVLISFMNNEDFPLMLDLLNDYVGLEIYINNEKE